MSDMHIGKMIKDVFAERKMSISDFAKAIHSSRTNIYDIFSRETIDVELLIRISEVLNFDFLKEIYQRLHPEKTPEQHERIFVAKEVSVTELDELKKNNEKILVFKALEEKS